MKLGGMNAETSRYVADRLAILTDQIGEVLAELHDDHRGPRDHLTEAWLTIWRMRWELGLPGGRVAADDPHGESEAAQ